MSDSNNNETKKGMPGNFILFLIIAFFVVLVVQNFLEVKTAKISFSYQLEPLVNLDLVKPEDNRKTAIGDSLVTFNGRFRDRLTDEGKKRYKFLSLLGQNHELSNESERIQGNLVDYRKRVEESADLFLHLSGIPVPSSGYVVIDDLQSSLGNNKSIVIDKLSPKDLTSLKDVQQQFESASQKSKRRRCPEIRRCSC